jgi:hypothetical protein
LYYVDVVESSYRTLRSRLVQSSKLASRLATKVQAGIQASKKVQTGTVQVAERCIKSIVYKNPVVLEPIIFRNAGADQIMIRPKRFRRRRARASYHNHARSAHHNSIAWSRAILSNAKWTTTMLQHKPTSIAFSKEWTTTPMSPT